MPMEELMRVASNCRVAKIMKKLNLEQSHLFNRLRDKNLTSILPISHPKYLKKFKKRSLQFSILAILTRQIHQLSTMKMKNHKSHSVV